MRAVSPDPDAPYRACQERVGRALAALVAMGANNPYARAYREGWPAYDMETWPRLVGRHVECESEHWFRRQSAENDHSVLVALLAVAVPLHIDELRYHTDAERDAIAADGARLAGDTLQYGSRTRGAAGIEFNRLARALAAAAYRGDGIGFLGLHWSATEAQRVRAVAASGKRLERT